MISRENILQQLTLPVIAAPMFLVSNPDTVITGCKGGIISSFPSLNARTSELLEEWLQRITRGLETKQKGKKTVPWAINVIVHRTNKRYEADMALIKKYQVPIVITSLGDPTEVIKEVHAYGGLVFSDVSTLKHARKTRSAGVDGLILVSAGAGGHGGILNPFSFLREVREFWDGLIVLAGGLSTGQEILAAQVAGADLVYMGTRFIAAEESSAKESYKNMLVNSTAENILYTDAFTGVNGNYLIPSIIKAGLDPSKLKSKETIDIQDMTVKAWKDIWSAGHGAGKTKKVQPMQEIIHELRQEYEQAKQVFTK